MRRLAVLIWGLPPDSITHLIRAEAEKKALKPTPEQIRARAEFYRRRRQEANEGGDQ